MKSVAITVFLINWILAWIVSSTLFTTVCGESSSYINFERQIHEKILKNYNRYVLPRVNSTTPVTIEIGIELRAIDDLDVKSQTMKIRTYQGYSWTDVQLKWDPASFGDIRVITVGDEKLWTPDLQFIDSAEPYLGVDINGIILVVEHTGRVSRWTMEKYKIPCELHIRQYPFDEQMCPFTFESWHHTSDKLIIKQLAGHNTLMTSQYQENSEWSLKGTNMTFGTTDYAGELYEKAEYVIHVKRKYLYHILYTAVPLACTSLLSITCFILPSENGERISLSVSLFLALAVLMTIVNNALPETSDQVAYFGIYVSMQLFWSGLTVFMTAVSSYFYFRKETGIKRSVLEKVLLLCAGDNSSSKAPKLKTVEKCHTAEESILPDLTPVDNENEKESLEQNVENGISTSMSIAIDRICLVTTVIWHITLNVCFTVILLS